MHTIGHSAVLAFLAEALQRSNRSFSNRKEVFNVFFFSTGIRSSTPALVHLRRKDYLDRRRADNHVSSSRTEAGLTKPERRAQPFHAGIKTIESC